MIHHQPSPTKALIHEASSLLVVTALCSAGSALTSTASAAVVSTPGISPSAPLTVPNTLDGVYINVLTGGTGTSGASVSGWDLNPYTTNGGGALSFFSPTAPTGGSIMRFPSSAVVSAGNLSGGTVVDGTGTFSASTTAVVFGSSPGNWALNASNYFGYRFQNEVSGQVHFGWGRMDVGATATERSIAELYYEDTAGASITVGAVPEPTGALLAAGAAGLVALRRRRQAA